MRFHFCAGAASAAGDNGCEIRQSATAWCAGLVSKQQVYINNCLFLSHRPLSIFRPHSSCYYSISPPLCILPTSSHSLLLPSACFPYSLDLTLPLFQLKAHKLQPTPFPCVINSPSLSSYNDWLIIRLNEFPPHCSDTVLELFGGKYRF